MSDSEYVVVDIETTGLSKYIHKMTEIAAVKVKNNRVVGEFQTLINPETHIPSFITRLTGINDEMVKDAPRVHEILPEFLDFLGDSTLVAHNATFDYGFIAYNVNKYLDKEVRNQKLCTRKLANRLLPDLPRKRLGDLCEMFEVQNDQAHRAMGDTKATVKVFTKFLAMLELADVKTHDDLVNFERMPVSKIRLNRISKY
jgi:DNA polymerase III subunit alpha, Gram-positive type